MLTLSSLVKEVGPLPDAVDAQFDYIWAQNTEGHSSEHSWKGHSNTVQPAGSEVLSLVGFLHWGS